MNLLSGANAMAVMIAGLLWLASAAGVRSEESRGFLNRVFKDASGQEAKYVLFVPHDYRRDKAYPLVLFLHGLGESGSDGRRQAAVGLGPAIKRQEKSFEFLTIFPQSRHRTWRPDSEDGRRALDIMAEVRKEYRIDPARVYLTGLSMGGYGTWGIAIRYPDRWAAIVPICGGGDPKQVDRIKDVPCWCFHGGADKTVPVARSREMIDALKAAGGHPLYTEYPGVGHKSWDQAYATPELYTWLLAQHLKQ
jgi:predicted peptidase